MTWRSNVPFTSAMAGWTRRGQRVWLTGCIDRFLVLVVVCPVWVLWIGEETSVTSWKSAASVILMANRLISWVVCAAHARRLFFLLSTAVPLLHHCWLYTVYQRWGVSHSVLRILCRMLRTSPSRHFEWGSLMSFKTDCSFRLIHSLSVQQKLTWFMPGRTDIQTQRAAPALWEEPLNPRWQLRHTVWRSFKARQLGDTVVLSCRRQ